MQIRTFSITNEVTLEVCTNPPPPPPHSSMVMMSLVEYTVRTWSSSPSVLIAGQSLDLCYKPSSPPPTIPANPGRPHTTTLNTTTPMPTSCANKPHNHNALLGKSTHQLTYNGAHPPCPHTTHSLIAPTLHPHRVFVHFNFSNSAWQKSIVCYYSMLPVCSHFTSHSPWIRPMFIPHCWGL